MKVTNLVYALVKLKYLTVEDLEEKIKFLMGLRYRNIRSVENSLLFRQGVFRSWLLKIFTAESVLSTN